jgi:predicted transcriptional regulator
MSAPKGYRDKAYIIKDIILTLGEYGELNQTALMSFCGLNLTKHRIILEELESHELIKKEEKVMGKRTITIFKATAKGMDFCRDILAPYEDLFPRKSHGAGDKKLRFLILA